MSDRVRVQLQEGTTNIDSLVPAGIAARETLAALAKLLGNNRAFKNDPKWDKALTAAINKAVAWVKRVQQGGGLVPRGSGNVHREEFAHGPKTYRIDIEVHGAKDAGWFQ